MRTAVAFAPATVANVAVGFDILGFPLEKVGERVTVERIAEPTVVIEPVPERPEISTDPKLNTAGAGLLELIRDRRLTFGFRVRLEKTIPVGSGLGGSATSAVGAIIAANVFLNKRLKTPELAHYALIGEAVASGSKHGDNVVPCLEGGLRLVRDSLGLPSVRIPTPPAWRAVVILPDLTINTKESRRGLRSEVTMPLMIEQNLRLSGFLLGCLQKNAQLVRESLRDVVIEPQRAPGIPGFHDMQTAAMEAGALGASISGSGPAVFALASSNAAAIKIHKAMVKACDAWVTVKGSWISPIAQRGTRLLKVQK